MGDEPAALKLAAVAAGRCGMEIGGGGDQFGDPVAGRPFGQIAPVRTDVAEGPRAVRPASDPPATTWAWGLSLRSCR